MSDGTPRSGRHAAPRPRRARTRLLVGAVVAAAVVVVVVAASLGGGGTLALWNGGATTNTATVRSGTATITVSAMTAMNTAVLGPGSGTLGTFTVKNTGTIPLTMRVQTTATSVAYSSTSDDAVLAELTLHLSLVASAADCRLGLGGASARLATFDTGSGYYTMPPGGSGTGCVEMDLDADAPQTIAGAVTNFTLTVTGTQVTS